MEFASHAACLLHFRSKLRCAKLRQGEGGYGLSVYGKQFKTRLDAFSTALTDLKSSMTAKIGSTDTTNDKQPIILGTLRDIEKAQVGIVQLSLF